MVYYESNVGMPSISGIACGERWRETGQVKVSSENLYIKIALLLGIGTHTINLHLFFSHSFNICP